MPKTTPKLLLDLSTELSNRLDRASKDRDATKTALARRALEIYLDHLEPESTKIFVVELSESAAEHLAAYRHEADLPDRSRLAEKAILLYVESLLSENPHLRERVEAAMKAAAKNRVIPLK